MAISQTQARNPVILERVDSHPQIEMPQGIEKLWNNYGNWRFEVSFSLQGGRCVYRELYQEYKKPFTLTEVLKKINENETVLVRYRFYSLNLVPMFPIYADGKLGSKVSPRKFLNRAPRKGATPFEHKSEDTLFMVYRFQKNEYSEYPLLQS